MTNAAQWGRTGSLAFLLGAGVALAIGSAASASAAPADDSTGPSVSDTASARSATRVQAKPVAQRTAAVPASRSHRQRQAAGAVAATATSSPVGNSGIPQGPTAAYRTVAAAAAVRRAPEATSSPAVAAPAASAVRAAHKWQMTITILPKIPLGLPATTIPWVKKVNGIATFTPKSVYDLHNVDQFDWNKLTGIGFSIPGDVNSSMVAWRYNVTSGNFEIAPFFNVDKARILPTQNEIITIPIGETFDFKVNYDGITITYGDKTVFKPTPEGLTPNFWTSYRTSVWFGGTSLPPNLMKLKLRYTW